MIMMQSVPLAGYRDKKHVVLHISIDCGDAVSRLAAALQLAVQASAILPADSPTDAQVM